MGTSHMLCHWTCDTAIPVLYTVSSVQSREEPWSNCMYTIKHPLTPWLLTFLPTLQPPPIRGRDGRGRNGVITSYTVSYGLNGVRTTVEQEVGSSVSSLLIRQLNLNSFYTLRVRAHTSAGAGSYSDGVTVSTGVHGTHTKCTACSEPLAHTAASPLSVTWPHWIWNLESTIGECMYVYITSGHMTDTLIAYSF